MPPIITRWIEQVCDPDVVKLVETFGDKRRIDLTLFSDRGRVNRPPKNTVT
jgi:hypothetical protein